MPKNESALVYNEIMEKDQVDLECFSSMQREMALTGSYRKIIVKPEAVQWEIIQEIIEKPALKIGFILPASSYATVCLREIIGEELGLD